MLAKIREQRGDKFKTPARYLLDKKPDKKDERVLFTHTENLPTNDPEKAWKWMAHTEISAAEERRGRGARGRPRKPVFTFVLSWPEGQSPDKTHMIETAKSALAALKLEEHQVLMVAHDDRKHKHLHLLINTNHPVTDEPHKMSFTKLDLSRWAENYEKEQGKIYCPERVENNARRRRETARHKEALKSDPKDRLKIVKHKDPEMKQKELITKLYRQTQDAKAFKAAIEHAGFRLAQGNKIVILDPAGKVFSLTRQIEGVKEKDVRGRLFGMKLQDLDAARADQLAAAEKAKLEAERKAREEEEERRKKERGRGQAAPSPAPAPAPANTNTRAERVPAKPDRYVGPPVPQKIVRLTDRQREETIGFSDMNRRIGGRWIWQTDRKYGAKEEVLRDQIALAAKALKELEGKRLMIRRKKAIEETRGRLDEMRYELAVIEDYKAVLRGRDTADVRTHAAGEKALKERHRQQERQLHQDPHGEREKGFNNQSFDIKPEKKEPVITGRFVVSPEGKLLKLHTEKKDLSELSEQKTERKDKGRKAPPDERPLAQVPESLQQKIREQSGSNDNKTPALQLDFQAAEEERIEAALEKWPALQEARGSGEAPPARDDFRDVAGSTPEKKERKNRDRPEPRLDPPGTRRAAVLEAWEIQSEIRQQERAAVPPAPAPTPAPASTPQAREFNGSAAGEPATAREQILERWENQDQDRGMDMTMDME